MDLMIDALSPSARLLALLSLLQARRDWPGSTLADRLAVSPRTVRRDVDRLRALGYPVHATKGPDGGYRLDPGADLPPLLFDDDQAIALTVALQAASTGVAGVDEAALRALATVRQVLPTRLRSRVDALQVTAAAPREATVDMDRLLAVGTAVRAREVLRFDYSTPATDAEPTPPRRAEPHHLVTWRGRWYLVAWDTDRADWRTFRVDRITPRTPTGPRFTPRTVPGGDVAGYIAAQFSGTTWPCTGAAVLEADAVDVARWAGLQAVVEALGPGRCRLVTGAWSWTAVAATLGMFDVEFEILGPPELVEAARLLAGRYARAVGA
jgi:predicted DNA-binding transcriptional regulator YafY